MGAHPDQRLARIAARQHGLVSHRQLAAVGLSPNAVAGRVEKGRLERLHRGVYAVGHVERTSESRWMAAVMACGSGAVLSHLDAAALWKIYAGEGARVHVTTTRKAGLHVDGVSVHRARRLHPEDVAVKDRIPVTTVARTLVDLTDLLAGDRLLRAIREAEFLRLLDLNTLNAAIQRAHGRKRLRVLKQGISAHTPGQIVREELEHRFLELVRAAGLPPPETNVKIKARGRTYEIDCLWREQRVAVELDGRAAHARTTAFEEDRRKDAALNAIGLRPLRFTWFRVTNEPADVIAELEATLALAVSA
jgi:predicted transcriptional regulator of viral defense system/very-short-patch-repair endonuclease